MHNTPKTTRMGYVRALANSVQTEDTVCIYMEMAIVSKTLSLRISPHLLCRTSQKVITSLPMGHWSARHGDNH